MIREKEWKKTRQAQSLSAGVVVEIFAVPPVHFNLILIFETTLTL